MRASVVVPVYNSEHTLGDLVSGLVEVLPRCTDGYEVVLIDDGSADGSWAAIEALVASTPAVRGVRLTRNFGEHNAVLCGIQAARYEAVVTIGDDLQQPPSEIPALLGALDGGTDVVYGTPERGRHGHARVAISRVAKWALEHLAGVPHATVISSFRAFRTDLRDAFGSQPGPRCSVDVLLLSATRRITSTPVRHDVRRVGRSNYTIPKLVDHSMALMTGASVRPLRVLWIVGSSLVLVGGLVVIALVTRSLAGTAGVPAAAMVGAVFSMLTGLQLLAIGVLGEYLAGMDLSLSGEPSYLTEASIEGCG